MYEADYEKVKYEESPYAKWRKKHCQVVEDYRKQSYEPLISVVIPVYNVKEVHLRACIDSICNQTYPNWELYLIDDCSTWEGVREVLKTYEDNSKIIVIYRKENGHISKATNDGIFVAKGEFIAFMDCDDVIETNALAEMVYYLNENPETDFVYSDEDKVSDDGTYYHNPFFKPDWSPDTMFSMMYTNHLAMYKRDIVCKVGGLRTEYNGSQDYDLTLRFMEHSDNKRVGHVPKILYHWRARPESAAFSPDSKPYTIDAAGRTKEDAIRRRGIDAELEFMSDSNQYRMKYNTTDNPLVSIVIPSKDNFVVLEQCIDSLIGITDYNNYEIIVVDNGSAEENKEIISKFLHRRGIVYVYEEMDFNFAKMCNIGAGYSKGEFILFLNDDIEIVDREWLGRMLGQAMQPHTGAVGAKLLYPENNCIQHIGICNLPIGPSHAFVGIPDSLVVSFSRNRLTYNWIAVTGACLLVSKKKFEEVQGFDERLTVAYNDVDLCFKLYEAGYYNVSRMDAVLYHHESFSRGYDAEDKDKLDRLKLERNILYDNHPSLKGKDPFYNVNLVKNNITYDLEMYGIDVNVYDINVVDKPYDSEETNLRVGIERIEKDSMVRIKGWAYSDNPKNDLEAKRYVMLRNKADQTIVVPAERNARRDLKERFDIDNLTEGFSCCIDRKILATNIFDYDIGLLQVAPDGVEDYVWSDMKVPHDGIEDINYLYYKRDDDYNSIELNDGILCSIDSCTFDSDVVNYRGGFKEITYIRGWAFIPGSASCNYRIEVGIVDDSQTDRIDLYDTIRETRYDVASSLSIESVYLSGFMCELPFRIEDNTKTYIVLTDMITNKKYMEEVELNY